MVEEGRDGGGEKKGEKSEEHDKCASCVSGCFEEERDIPCSGGTWQIVPSTGDHKWKWSGIYNDFSHNIKKNLNIQNITLKKNLNIT